MGRLSVAAISRAAFAGVLALCGPVASADPGVFEDVTESAGLTGPAGSSAAWGDFDNDGRPDLYDGVSLRRNVDGTRFVTVGDLPLQGDGIWGDFDNDGFLDLFCYASGKLFCNLEGAGFAEVSEAIPSMPMAVSRGACWGDFDRDGYLDLYVGGYEIWQQAVYPDVLLRNEGGKGFREVWRTSGKLMSARGVTCADFDEDGDLDIYVSNYRLFPNLLWRNRGTGMFDETAEALGVSGDGKLGAWGHTIGSAWGDLDNDGHIDLFVGNFSHPPEYQDRPMFLRNRGPEGEFGFEDRSAAAGLHWQESYASPSLADYDNDGDLDLFFTTVYPGDHSVLYRNDGDWSFADATAAAGVATEKTYQSAWADFDDDGDLDLMSGGKLFRNPGNGNHWLKVRLRGGGRVNRAAIGARVNVGFAGRTLCRQVEGATGEGNQNDLTLHFGLGGHAGPVRLTVVWPDGSTRTTETEPDRTLTLAVEPE